MSEPFVITVCHQKGGVAKTTTVSALGASMAEAEYRTLVIDLDPSTNLTTGLGLNPAKVNKSAADILLGNEPIANVCRPTDMTYLDIVPSNADMGTVSRFLYLRKRYEFLIKENLDQMTLDGFRIYDFVIIDCPPSLDSITTTALTAANMAIIPTQCEYYSIQALNGVFRAVKNTRERTNPSLRYRILVTMFDRRGKLHTRIYEHFKQRFSDAILNTVIGFDSKLRESQMLGVPVIVHAPKTRAAQQYRSLSSELYAYVQTQSVPQPAERNL
jgi:chromosome partitioning protein